MEPPIPSFILNWRLVPRERSRFQPVLVRAHPIKPVLNEMNLNNITDNDTMALRITVRIRTIRINRRHTSLRDHDHHICNNPGTASKKRCCSCGKCSLVALFEHTCPQAYGSLTPFLQSITLMSFYSSDFLLPIDNWWKILNSALLPLGDLATGLPLPSALHTSTVAACDGKQCFRLRRAWTSTSLQDEVNNNINFFRAGKGTLSTCFNSAKEFWQLWNHQARLLDSNFSSEWTSDDGTTDPKDLVNIVLLLLIIAGDIELNPGPESGNLPIWFPINMIFM